MVVVHVEEQLKDPSNSSVDRLIASVSHLSGVKSVASVPSLHSSDSPLVPVSFTNRSKGALFLDPPVITRKMFSNSVEIIKNNSLKIFSCFKNSYSFYFLSFQIISSQTQLSKFRFD